MAVDGLQPITVIDHDAISIDAQRRGPHDLAVICSDHWSMLSHRKIEAQVNLLIDFLTLIYVAADIREFRFHFRIRQLEERLRPKEFLFRLKAQAGQRLVVRNARFAIDLQESVQKIAGASWGSI